VFNPNDKVKDAEKRSRRYSLLNRRKSTELAEIQLAKTSKQAFTEKVQEQNPSFRGRKGSMLRLGGRRTSIKTLVGCNEDSDDDDDLYDKSSSQRQGNIGTHGTLTSSATSTYTLPPQQKPLKSAIQRGKDISKKSAKFHYCWTGNEKISRNQKSGYGFGHGYQRDKVAKKSKPRRRKSFMYDEEDENPDIGDLSKAYAHLGYGIQDVSELMYVYNQERVDLQRLMIKAMYTGYVVTKLRSSISSYLAQLETDKVAQRLSRAIWRRRCNYVFWKVCGDSVDTIKWVMRHYRHIKLQKALYTAMQKVRTRIVNAQRHWRWLAVRKAAREEVLIKYCLNHEFTFLEEASKIREYSLRSYAFHHS
jgi:hypothetical protein